nr:hypothetical protein [Klebsiella pneumoniae]
MHAFIFLVLMTPSSGGGIWDITPMPNTDVCIKMLRVLEARGAEVTEVIQESALKLKPASL